MKDRIEHTEHKRRDRTDTTQTWRFAEHSAGRAWSDSSDGDSDERPGTRS